MNPESIPDKLLLPKAQRFPPAERQWTKILVEYPNGVTCIVEGYRASIARQASGTVDADVPICARQARRSVEHSGHAFCTRT